MGFDKNDQRKAGWGKEWDLKCRFVKGNRSVPLIINVTGKSVIK